MKNECVFYDKPRMAYVSDTNAKPNIADSMKNILGIIYYDNTPFYIYMTFSLYISSYKYATFIDEPVEKPRRIEDGLKYGDIIVNKDGKRKVLGIVDEVIFISFINDFDRIATTIDTLSEIISKNYKLESEVKPIEEVEMTVAEISKELNKRVKIVE